MIPSRSAIGRRASTRARLRSRFPADEQRAALLVAPAEVAPIEPRLGRDRAREQPVGERAVRQHARALLAAPPDQVAVLQPEHRELLLQRVDVPDRLAPLDQVAVEVRHADEPDEAVVHQLAHGAPGLLDRGPALVRPVELVQVEVVGTEPPQAPLARRTHLGRPEARAVGLRGDLGEDQGLVTPTLDGPCHELLGTAPAVDLGRVDPVDPGLEHRPDRLEHLLLGGRLAPFGSAARLPGPEPDHGHLRTPRTQPVPTHVCRSWSFGAARPRLNLAAGPVRSSGARYARCATVLPIRSEGGGRATPGDDDQAGPGEAARRHPVRRRLR